ncbi:hypothetical protein KAU32_07545 [bacterium]|nr:hypothetical protein [bacterium]
MFNDYEYQYATDSNRLLVERSMNGAEILNMTNYLYDSNGNTARKDKYNGLMQTGYEEYLWNCENQMIGYRKYDKNIKSHLFDLTDAVDIEYNLAGMRLTKKVYNPRLGTLNENDSVLYLYEGSEVELELTIHNDDILSKKSLFYYGLGKKLYSKEFSSDGTVSIEKIFHQDILGNNMLLTDTNGNYLEKILFGPFGDVISEKRRSPSSSIQHPTSNKFTGKERDKESNLDYFGARYLDYNNGRWMKPDVVKGKLINPQSLNRNIYGQNRPLFFIDIGGNDVYVFYWGYSLQNPKGHVAIAVEVVLRGNLRLFLFATNPPEEGRTLRDLKKGVPVNRTIGQNIDPESMDEYTGEVAGQKPKGILRINTDGLANGLSGDQIYDIFLGGISEEEIYDLDENNCAHYVIKMLEKIGVDLQIKGVITPRKVKKAIKKYNKKQQRRKETKKRITAWHEQKAEEFFGDHSDFREALYQRTMHD